MTSKNSFFKILEKAKVEIAEDIPTTGFIDTGSYALNALLSASIYGGIPNNRTVMYAGDPSAGKTYLILEGVKAFQQNEPDGNVVYFDTEFALDDDSVEARGIDIDRFHLVQPDHWQQFKTQALNILDAYEAEKPGKKERKPPMLMVLDSLGQLPTKKEIEDTASGSDTKDMTKAAIAKSAFRILTQKMGKNNVPMLIANHTYDSLSAYTAKAIAGGCLEAGTKIRMADGSLRSIEDVKVGEYVQTLNGDHLVTNVWNPETLEQGTPECFEIEFSDGTKITCSASHKFMIDGEWVEARDLVEGDTLTIA